MKVTEIEVCEITHEFCDWTAYPLEHYDGPRRHTIYVAHTDTGLVGLGEKGGAPDPPEVLERYIGSNPFDWMVDETSIGLGIAMYDLMGQAAGVPIYKLFGQKYRSWVAVASWTVSSAPSHMAEAVKRYAAQGHTWMKYHLSPFENVFDQTAAMEEVAPRGFRIHYDFTGGGTTDKMADLLERLSRHRIAGCFEDSLHEDDVDASIELRKRIRLPLVRHRAATDHTFEVFRGPSTAYMLGHYKIDKLVQSAGLFAAGNIPFMIQWVGGTITRAMVTHMMAAFPSATLHTINAGETLKSDVVAERMEPVNGFVRVLEKPGLGLTLDRDELSRLCALELEGIKPWIIRSRFADGSKMYHKYDVKTTRHFLIRPDWRRDLVPMSYDAPITTDYWDDDGSPEFRAMMSRLETEGMVLER